MVRRDSIKRTGQLSSLENRCAGIVQHVDPGVAQQRGEGAGLRRPERNAAKLDNDKGLRLKTEPSDLSHIQWAERAGKTNTVVRTVQNWQLGILPRAAIQRRLLNSLYGTILKSLTETEFHCGKWDKAFACAWLNHDTIAVGTKCNTLVCLSTVSGSSWEIPLPPTPPRPAALEGHCISGGNCGIHAIAINPSGDLLATGGANPSDCAVYLLPSMEPLQTLVGHQDWVFGMDWIDERYLVTGSRDSTIKLWEVKLDGRSIDYQPLCSGKAHKEKVRDVKYSSGLRRVATLGSDGTIKFWDDNFQVEHSVSLKYKRELVCMDVQETTAVVGSQSHVTVVDGRQRHAVCHIKSPDSNQGVRSVNIFDHQLTFGSGKGKVYFYDLRARTYPLGKLPGSRDVAHLLTGDGWLEHNDVYRDFFSQTRVYNACYGLAWDANRTRLFTCGGPLAYGLKGSYMALWH